MKVENDMKRKAMKLTEAFKSFSLLGKLLTIGGIIILGLLPLLGILGGLLFLFLMLVLAASR